MFSWYSLNLFSISVPVLSARQHLKINFWCRLWEEVTLWKRNVLEHWGGVVQFTFWTLNKLLRSRGSNEVKALNQDSIYTVRWKERIIPILVENGLGICNLAAETNTALLKSTPPFPKHTHIHHLPSKICSHFCTRMAQRYWWFHYHYASSFGAFIVGIDGKKKKKMKCDAKERRRQSHPHLIFSCQSH